VVRNFSSQSNCGTPSMSLGGPSPARMAARSSGGTWAWAGSRYISTQAMAMARPATPATRNIVRQPNATISSVSKGGASAGARAEDELNRLIGSARSFSANQSAQTRVPPIYIGDSPSPSPIRAAMNWPSEPTNPAPSCAADHSTSPTPSARRGPNRSTASPAGICASP
jgi:hypothetical protein